MDNFRIEEKNTWNVIKCSICQFLVSDYEVFRTRKEIPNDLIKLPQIRKHIKEDRHQSKMKERRNFAETMYQHYAMGQNKENYKLFSERMNEYAADIEFYDKYIIKKPPCN